MLDFTSDVAARARRSATPTAGASRRRTRRAALSEPVQPIVFWLDRNIPVATASRSRAGILEWNKAFERIGFKDAIRVEVQPDDADFDTSDIRHASVRWQTVAKTSYGAIGPSVVDPRTGEILDADIGIDANNVRVVRNLRHEYLPAQQGRVRRLRQALQRRRSAAASADAAPTTTRRPRRRRSASSLLEARGDLDPDSPDVDRVRRHVPEERDDARGRPYARPAPQLPRVDGLHATRSSPTADFTAQARHLAAR